MPKIVGEIHDRATGLKVAARVQVIGPGGQVVTPAGALMKVGTGEPFFYSDGQFSVDAGTGYSRVLVERGTEYRPWSRTVKLSAGETCSLDIGLERWADLPDRGWHPGNTHIHYDEKETRPDERLWLDPRVEDLRMTAVSILQRWDLKYATNKYPVGVLNDFTDTHHFVQNGEESRHNADPNKPYEIGYGHVMLLNIRNIVEPLSRGLLVDPFSPDYPPLSYVCDEARRQGGVVIWCHNGQGMEAPVAAALGKLDAMNLFDPFWTDIEYGLWYRMLNCGVRLPVSTGSDWFVCSANRVYSQTGGEFQYDSWLQGLRAGNTFITNGPAIFLNVDGKGPGETVTMNAGGKAEAEVTWSSHYAVEVVEVVLNGIVAARKAFPAGSKSGTMRVSLPVKSDGWIGARLGSTVRDSFAQPIWAHTSPVYVRSGVELGDERREAAAYFDAAIERSMEWVTKKGKFYTDSQRREVVDLFRQGQEWYRRAGGIGR